MNDTMSVHELVLELQESMRQACIKWKPVDLNQREELESALRKAVIREASVGDCNFYLAENENGCLVPTFYAYDVAKKSIDIEGVYHLIPNEVEK